MERRGVCDRGYETGMEGGEGGGKANTYDHALSHRWHFVAHPVFVGEGVGAWADDLDGVCDFCRLASIGHGVLVMAFV